MTNQIIYGVIGMGLLALIFTYWKATWVAKQEVGNKRMERIAGHIKKGAMAFLLAEYKVLWIFVAAVFALLAFSADPSKSSWMIGVSFVFGALFSAIAGFIGMRVATNANVRTTNAARKGLGHALEVAFTGGSVMGLAVVGLGLFGLSSLFLIYSGLDWNPNKVIAVVTGFSFGASSIALFARVGGGIYTKTADVGADLVGKVEAGIPEDHPLNPATIADNVGDNVGDVAGMGADLFESYVGSIISTMVLGALFIGAAGFTGETELNAVLLPLVIAATGILTSIFGTFFVKVKEGGNPAAALHRGEILSGILMIVLTFFVVQWLMPTSWTIKGFEYTSLGIFFAIIIGLVSGTLIGLITEYLQVQIKSRFLKSCSNLRQVLEQI
jgi:K(+)-stimulated pyrophosphate-energized sodium pump